MKKGENLQPLAPSYARPVFYGVSGPVIVAFYLAAALALAVLAWGVWLRVSLWFQSGRPAAGDFGGRRGWRFVVWSLSRFFSADCLLARRVFRYSVFRGIALILVIWGFLLLLTASLLLAVSHDFGLAFLHGEVFYVYKLVVNWAGAAFVLGILGMLVRRLFLTPARRRVNAAEDLGILLTFFLVGGTGFLVEGSRMAAQGPATPELFWPTPGAWAGRLFLTAGPASAGEWHQYLWFFHVFLALCTIAYIPFSKLFHIYVAPLTTDAGSLDHSRAGKTASAVELLPASRTGKGQIKLWEGLSTLNLASLDACTRCGQCLEFCPVQEAGGTLEISPPEKISLFKGLLASQRGAGALLRGERSLDKGKIDRLTDALYRCTVCGVCGEHCPVGVNCLRLWPALRHKMVELESGPVGPQRDLRTIIFQTNNPYGQPHADRLAFIPPEVKVLRQARTAFFAGCSGAYAARPMVAGAVKVLQAAGVEFTILDDEWCCGFPLWIVGEHQLVEELVRHNVEALEKRGVRRLVTSCPCCLNMIVPNWPVFLGRELAFEVVHTTEVVAPALAQGRLVLTREYRRKVTYHDPCNLARGSREVIRPPRQVLEYVHGLELVEMPDHGRFAKCCGAGGGIRRAHPPMSIDMANNVMLDADKLGVDELLIDCPACFERLHLARTQPGHPSDIPVLDLMQVVAGLI